MVGFGRHLKIHIGVATFNLVSVPLVLRHRLAKYLFHRQVFGLLLVSLADDRLGLQETLRSHLPVSIDHTRPLQVQLFALLQRRYNRVYGLNGLDIGLIVSLILLQRLEGVVPVVRRLRSLDAEPHG